MPWSVGDKVVYGGIGCVIAYDAGSEQSWGRYILCEEYDLNHYEPDLGTGGVDEVYSGKPWGTVNQDDSGANATAIGTGKTNTDYLINKYLSNSSLWYYVSQHRNSTHKLWSVPSKDELDILYENKEIIGKFTTNLANYIGYWSSSEYSSKYAWSQYFSNGSQLSNDLKNNTLRRVRCVAYATEADLGPSPSTVSISCATEGASIYYTVDGNDPTEQSTLYSASFQATAPATIKARAYKEGLEASEIATATISS